MAATGKNEKQQKLQLAQQKADALKNQLQSTAADLLERGEILDNRLATAETLEGQAKKFETQADAVKRQQCLKNARAGAVIVGLVLTVAAVLFFALYPWGK